MERRNTSPESNDGRRKRARYQQTSSSSEEDDVPDQQQQLPHVPAMSGGKRIRYLPIDPLTPVSSQLDDSPFSIDTTATFLFPDPSTIHTPQSLPQSLQKRRVISQQPIAPTGQPTPTGSSASVSPFLKDFGINESDILPQGEQLGDIGPIRRPSTGGHSKSVGPLSSHTSAHSLQRYTTARGSTSASPFFQDFNLNPDDLFPSLDRLDDISPSLQSYKPPPLLPPRPRPTILAGFIQPQPQPPITGKTKPPGKPSVSVLRSLLQPQVVPPAVASPPQMFSGVDNIDLNYLGTVQNNRRYEVVRSLSAGAYGAVVMATRHPDNTNWAIKVLKAGTLYSTVDTIQKEIDLVQRLNQNPYTHVLAFNEILLSPQQRVYIVCELCTSGDLFEFMERRDQHNQLLWRTFQEDEAKYLTRGIANGVRHLHSMNIAHGDLKPENVLLFERAGGKTHFPNVNMSRFIPKICDFSNSRSRRTNDPPGQIRAIARTCTINYSAPESGITMAPPYDMISADVYSIACVLLSILIGGAPFVPNSAIMTTTGKSYDVLCNALKINAITLRQMIYSYNVSNNLKDLLWRALTQYAQNRISLHQLLMHAWFFQQSP